MDRRAAAAALVVLAVGLAGCGAVVDGAESLAGTDSHPLAGETATVAVDGTDRERALVADALAYWEREAPTHAGFDVAFRLVGPGETPTDGPLDVRVRFVDEVTDCGGADYSAGCAPQINASTRFDRPASVSIQRGLANESTRLVVEHELGHVLGLSHDDEPRDVMRHRRELARLPEPNATERPVPWPDATLTVAVDNGSLPADERAAYRREVGYAMAYVAEGADGTVPGNVTVEWAADPESADLVVRAVDEADCRDSAGSCVLVEGIDPDQDRAIETYTRVEVVLVDLDREAASWHVARQTLVAFGVPADELPEPMADATYAERRGEWHG
ncbi:matrixin family metalloprotease [Haloarcula litorea]|uniref:matrixin family metalloprotease n=1 Tax=Haloarcula litorea TaxID=3032579 RepID=UPI0023E81551|nr:matrixin family metalloprotease [Halomicroarcula sp. GDY20]